MFKSVQQNSEMAQNDGPLPVIEKAKDFTAGETVLIGTYEGTITGENQYGAYQLHTFQDSEGNRRTINGVGHLNWLIGDKAALKGGEVVKLVYLGKETVEQGAAKGRQVHRFDLQLDSDA